MEPRELVERWVSAFNRGDADAIADFYAEDAVNHQVVREPVIGRGCGFFEVVDDRIVFQRGYFDELSFLRQQGLPLPAE